MLRGKLTMYQTNRVQVATGGLALFLILAPVAWGERGEGSLADVEVPLPGELDRYVSDRDAARRLGKALFWDVQVGSDGDVACATCHNGAGVDHRTRNQINPGFDGGFDIAGPGAVLRAGDFPFHPKDDIAGSGGVDKRDFVAIVPGDSVDIGDEVTDPVFGPERQVTGRATPSTINAIFNELNFWDGRAVDVFNGVTVGNDDSARIYAVRGGEPTPIRIAMQPASAASQAVGPALSDVEMSWAGRPWPELGRKMFSLRPLGQQEVARTDSLLGELVRRGEDGLDTSYMQLVRDAFRSEYWDSAVPVSIDGENFTLMEANFSFFWGLSILMYESTLVSDETRYDAWASGRGKLTRKERRGFEVFEGEGRCDQCHGGPLFTGAAIDGGGDAFANIGVRPTREDRGRSDGEFKTPTLRNVELTGPYFHTGGYLTLRQVVDFYDRGGDFDNEEKDSQIRELELSNREKEELVAFMLTLTDERVRFQQAPFDHPELPLPDGDTLPSVGAEGGPEVRPFLGVDPFTR